MNHTQESDEIEEASEDLAEPFVAELKRWREVRGCSQKSLASKVGYTASYISKVEGGHQRPSTAFVRSADLVLTAGGAIKRVFRDFERASSTELFVPEIESESDSNQQTDSLVVEHDDASLHYDGKFYRAVMRRTLRNASNQPISRYLVRISVDRYPGNPERSNQLYREDPLTWEELDLHAQCQDEEMIWKVQHDRDAFKEVWLLFQNPEGQFPLYPGETTRIEYAYTVKDTKWGHWFQRAVRLPTERLSVKLLFPANLEPVVWGTETTMTAEAFPFRTAIEKQIEESRNIYTWSTASPPLHARFRMEWKFKTRKESHEGEGIKPSAQMESLGIVQEGDPILGESTKNFDFPAEAEDARRAVAELASAADRVAAVHPFGKGMGLAAPQIGIDRSVAIVKPPGSETLALFNPKVIDQSEETDTQYEGCLSFFDVRGQVPRPLHIDVEHQDVDGTKQITHFERGAARLVLHEIDHLEGRLYKTRMVADSVPISVTQYKETGKQWKYQP